MGLTKEGRCDIQNQYRRGRCAQNVALHVGQKDGQPLCHGNRTSSEHRVDGGTDLGQCEFVDGSVSGGRRLRVGKLVSPPIHERESCHHLLSNVAELHSVPGLHAKVDTSMDEKVNK